MVSSVCLCDSLSYFIFCLVEMDELSDKMDLVCDCDPNLNDVNFVFGENRENAIMDKIKAQIEKSIDELRKFAVKFNNPKAKKKLTNFDKDSLAMIY